jgi:hypothetical protein
MEGGWDNSSPIALYTTEAEFDAAEAAIKS